MICSCCSLELPWLLQYVAKLPNRRVTALILTQAFPVLCRILTELKLLSTPVGIITLAAGVGDDVVGWVRPLDSYMGIYN